MTAFIYAIVSCVAASGGSYCHLLGQPFLFQSADQCMQAMTTRLGRGNLVGPRLYASNSSKVWYECDQRPTSEWTQIQPTPTKTPTAASPPKSYTIAICYKSGGPCKQVLPAIHETAVDCLTYLYKETVVAKPTDYDLDGGEGRVYPHGKPRDLWMQCYDTRK